MQSLRPLLALPLLLLCITTPSVSQDAAEDKPPLPLGLNDDSFLEGDPSKGGVHELMALFFDRVYHWVPTETGPQLRPSLAKALPVYSQDGLTATITLRKDIAFNGIEDFGDRRELRVRAQDVVANIKAWLKFDRHRGGLADALKTHIVGCTAYQQTAKLSPSWTANDLVTPISGIECKDDFTLEVKLLRPTGMLPLILAHNGAIIWPAEAFAKGKRSIEDEWILAGTGPLMFDERTNNDVFQRNPGFRGEPAETPEFNTRSLAHNANPAELLKLWTENPSGYWALGGRHADLFIEAGTDPTVVVTRAEELHYLAFNMRHKIWGGLDADGCGLRAAVFHGLEPVELITELDKSFFIAANGPTPEIRGFKSPWVEADWKPLGHAEGRKLLRTTKYASGQNPADGSALILKILCPDTRFATAFRDKAEPLLVKAGIGVLVESANNEQDFLERISKGNYEAVYYGWRNDWPDHADMLLRLHSRNAACPVEVRVPCQLESKELDALLDAVEAIAPLDRDKRAEAITKVTAWLAKHRPYIPVASPQFVNLVGTDTVMPELPWSVGNTIRYLKRK